MRRTMRLAAIAVGVLGLVATTAPQPAQARTVGTTVFVADVTVSDGLGYPILTLTIRTNVLPAPGATVLQTLGHLVGGSHPSTNCLQLPKNFLEDPLCLTNSHWTFPNLRTLTAGSVACVDLLLNIAKPGKQPVHPPGCGFATTAGSLPNTVTGHCGLSSGQLVVLYTDGLGQSYIVDIHFKAFASKVFISGHFDKLNSNQHGLVLGVADAIPPVGLSQSCVNKTARDFTVVGAVTFIGDPNLP